MTVIHYQDETIPPSKYSVIRWFGFDQFVPERAVTSYWVSSRTFFIIRFIVALYSTIVFWTYLGFEAAYWDFTGFFAAFTTLTFVGLHSYLVTSCVYHFRYLRNKNVDFMLGQPSFLNYLYMYLYSTIVTFNILTPVVFWSILSSGATHIPLIDWLNISVHGVSFFLMITDVILNRMKLPIRMVLFAFFTVLFYMVMAFIIFASTGKWEYPFLNWSQGPRAALYYFMVAIIVVVSFFIMVLIHLLRDWIARKTGKGFAVATADKEVEEYHQKEAQTTEPNNSSTIV